MIHFKSESQRILYSPSIIFLESVSSIIAVWLLRFGIFENIVQMSPLLEVLRMRMVIKIMIFDRLNNEDVYDEENE